MIMSVYIAEISPKEVRGRTASLIGPAFTIGVLLAAVTNVGFSKFALGWRVTFGIQAVLLLLYAVGMGCMPHTPRYVPGYICICIK